MTPLLAFVLASLTPAGVSPAPDAPRASQPLSPAQDYVSELPKAGLTAKMFDTPVKPRANLARLFATEDYPLESIRNAEEGTVGVVVRVGTDGQVADCIVERSSGFAALDLQTCRILWLRARFVPARNRQGDIIESATRARIRWELPQPEPMPIKDWGMRLTLDFVEDGGVVSCKVEATGAMKVGQEKIGQENCGFFLRLSDGFAKLRAEADYAQRRVVMETQFSKSRAEPQPIAPTGMHLAARQVARLTIDETGKPLQCRVIATEGPAGPGDGCDDLLADRYEKPGIAAGAIEVTVARNLYLPD